MSIQAEENPKGIVTAAKDAIPFVALAFAGLYGFGWMARRIAVAELGVGPLLDVRESSIAAGLTFCLFLFMAATGVTFIGRSKAIDLRMSPKRTGAFLTAGTFGVFATMFLGTVVEAMRPHDTISTSTMVRFGFFGVTMSASLALLLAALRPRDGATETSKTLVQAGAFLAALTALLTFARIILPSLPSALGGFDLTAVEYKVKESPVPTHAVLVASDAQFAVFARPDQPKGKRHIRIPWSSIEYVRDDE